MVVAIVGSRDFPKLTWVDDRVHRLKAEYAYRRLKVISGSARGVDSRARVACRDYWSVPFEEYPADWDALGKRAGYVRNRQMVEMADLVIAFWDGESRGTKHTIDLALSLKKPLEVHFPPVAHSMTTEGLAEFAQSERR